MGCERIARLLSAKLDGELTGREAAELKEHLAVCPACRALEAQLAALHEPLMDMEELQAPEGFARGVMDKIRTEEAAKPKVIPFFRRPQVRALAGLAACAVLCVGLYRGAAPGGETAAAAPAAELESQIADVQPVAASDSGAGAVNDHVIYAAVEETAEKTKAADQQRTLHDAAAAPSHYAFANDRYIPVTYGSTPEAPSARILGSAESLAAFLSQFPMDDLTELEEMYGPDFFETGRLLAVVLEEGSGSVRHAIAPQGLLWEQVIVRWQVPEAGTCDMAAWLILAEVDSMFADGQTFAVTFATSK